ncbi:hypothetical protein HBO23_00225 [Pseudomonas sp. WS 5532]|uniref:hypothetical protein n=1 Tax=Pseudomonas sp. WS 5532 TaxID=2717495 RepID=UPI0014729BBE|nr:hypothetical protein [Pseudomonas sp. WS 5532]NMX71375.1 hypothetical protein [Pseudomonas sp. WS 5532]
MKRLPCAIPASWFSSRLALYIFYPFERNDVKGRNVLEGRSGVAFIKPEDYALCRYPDYRYNSEKLMNIGALKELSAIYNNARNLIGIMADQIRTSSKCGAPVHPVIKSAFLSYVGWTLPLYRHLVGKEINTTEASVSKLSHGVLSAFLHALYTPNSGWEHWSDAGEVVNYIYDNKLLNGRREVCAASPRMIKLLVEEIFSQNKHDRQPQYVEQIDKAIYFAQLKLQIEYIISRYEILKINTLISNGTILENVPATFAFPLQHHIRRSYHIGTTSLMIKNLELRTKMAGPIIDMGKCDTHQHSDLLDKLNICEKKLCELIIGNSKKAHVYTQRDLDLYLGGSTNYRKEN